jgi:hypothetical protein
MRILLSSHTRGLFLKTESLVWTAEAAEAKSFPTVEQAIAVAEALDLADLQVYFSHQDEGMPDLDFAATFVSFSIETENDRTTTNNQINNDKMG